MIIERGTYKTSSGNTATVEYFDKSIDKWIGKRNGLEMEWDVDGKTKNNTDNLVISLTLLEALKALKDGKRIQHKLGELIFNKYGYYSWKDLDDNVTLVPEMLTGWSLITESEFVDCIVYELACMLVFNYKGKDYAITEAPAIVGFMGYVYDAVGLKLSLRGRPMNIRMRN